MCVYACCNISVNTSHFIDHLFDVNVCQVLKDNVCIFIISTPNLHFQGNKNIYLDSSVSGAFKRNKRTQY